MSDEQIAAPQTHQVQPQPTPVTPADEDLLKRLTEPRQVGGLPESKPPVTQPTQNEPSPAQPDKNILDELSGRSKPSDTQNGDSSNA
jgi:hypothetical protein